MRIPKLVAFDVDGTLVGRDGQVSERTRRTLDRLRSTGIAVALATGRSMADAEVTLAQVGGADWMVCGNGSTLFDPADGVFLRDRFLPEDLVEPVMEGLRGKLDGIGLALELSRSMLDEVGFSSRVPEPSQAPPVLDALAAWRADRPAVRRVICFHDDFDHRLDDLAAMVSSLIDHRCQVQYGGLRIVEVAPAGDNKAVALQVLTDHLGIEPADVLAFGDGRNDIEMLEWAGVGVAMGNAHPEVQRRADAVTATVDGEGIEAYLGSFLARLR